MLAPTHNDSDRVTEAFGGALKPRHYRLVYLDPAWAFKAGPAKNPGQKYRVMKLKDIMALPVRDLAHPEGMRVYMWVTVPHLRNGFRVFDAWGVRYSSARFWVKLWPSEDGMFVYPDSMSRGTGYEHSSDVEVLMLGKIGRPAKAPNPKPRNSFFDPRREHSRKPDAIREWLATTFPGPRAELFSRAGDSRWDHWGDQAGTFAHNPQ